MQTTMTQPTAEAPTGARFEIDITNIRLVLTDTERPENAQDSRMRPYRFRAELRNRPDSVPFGPTGFTNVVFRLDASWEHGFIELTRTAPWWGGHEVDGFGGKRQELLKHENGDVALETKRFTFTDFRAAGDGVLLFDGVRYTPGVALRQFGRDQIEFLFDAHALELGKHDLLVIQSSRGAIEPGRPEQLQAFLAQQGIKNPVLVLEHGHSLSTMNYEQAQKAKMVLTGPNRDEMEKKAQQLRDLGMDATAQVDEGPETGV